MTGILVMNKPEGFTSFDVVAKLRGICSTRRIGHSGTLDPMATGVLPVFIGEATKAVDMQENSDKTYEATFLLGVKTNTADITGEIIERADVDSSIDERKIKDILRKFVGECKQIPPMYSAVKINGVPLYKLARKGEEVERKERTVTIYSIELIQKTKENEYKICVHCSKGTYIRTLIEDIARELGTIGTMTALCRTTAGAYTIENAVTFEKVQAAKDAGTLENMLESISTVFEHLPRLSIDETIYKRLANGAPTYKFNAKNGEYSVFFKQLGSEKTTNCFIGVGCVKDNVLTAKKIFVR